jgi:hypothetical protein
MKNKLALILGSASLAFTSTVLLVATSPAFAVDHGDNGGANYAGIEWNFGTITSRTGNCGRGPCTDLKPRYTVKATVRTNGKVCNDHRDFSDEALIFEQKAYSLCGRPAIIMGSPGGTMRAYYWDNWVDSPAHSEGGIFSSSAKHYWYSNW